MSLDSAISHLHPEVISSSSTDKIFTAKARKLSPATYVAGKAQADEMPISFKSRTPITAPAAPAASAASAAEVVHPRAPGQITSVGQGLTGLVTIQTFKGSWVLNETFAQLIGVRFTTLTDSLPRDQLQEVGFSCCCFCSLTFAFVFL